LSSGGIDVWSDRELGLGGRWLNEISAAITCSRAVILLASPVALASKWVMWEVCAAQTLGIPMVPLLAAGTRYGDLPVNLAGVNGVDLAEGYEEMVVASLADTERPRVAMERATAQARMLVLLTADEDLACQAGAISRSVGLVVRRPNEQPDVLVDLLTSAHIALIDDHAPYETSFAAGYVAGRGGWVVWLADDRDNRPPAAPGIRFCPPDNAALEREICAAAFLPRRLLE
jgi:hypothetical protein